MTNYRQFEDTQIYSEINYIDNFTNKMISINTNKLLVPFTIPQISFKDQELPEDKDWQEFESIQARQEFDRSRNEARSALKDFLDDHNITFNEKEDETGYLIIGKDYRGHKIPEPEVLASALLFPCQQVEGDPGKGGGVHGGRGGDGMAG